MADRQTAGLFDPFAVLKRINGKRLDPFVVAEVFFQNQMADADRRVPGCGDFRMPDAVRRFEARVIVFFAGVFDAESRLRIRLL